METNFLTNGASNARKSLMLIIKRFSPLSNIDRIFSVYEPFGNYNIANINPRGLLNVWKKERES
jgi:hypothetical protein